KKLSTFLVVISIYMLGNSLSYAFDLSMRHISGQERNAMHWVEQNTRLDSTFLVISGNQNAFCDPINEWFPALTKRKSLTTIQGSEWLLGKNFGNNVSQVQRLQSCIDEGMGCFNRETSQFGRSFDYVYISIASSTNNCELSESSTRTTRGLAIALENEPGYSIAYRSEKAILFQKK
ncbi:MAG TPA: hypothetical protein VFI68_03810, partial [Anaerolineales bacterium]|nr:hypothetical protein [Anaerolineales bacterium]